MTVLSSTRGELVAEFVGNPSLFSLQAEESKERFGHVSRFKNSNNDGTYHNPPVGKPTHIKTRSNRYIG